MDATAQRKMPRSYQRRTAKDRVADLERKIAELKARQAAREKKDDPVLREMQKLLKRLKLFIQHALDHNRPDVANSALGFKALLERSITSEGARPAGGRPEAAAEDDA